MNKINLLGNLMSDPFTIEPKEAKIKRRGSWPSKKTSEKKPETKTIVMCSCENHPVNPRKDIYKQHNHWVAQQDFKLESNNTRLQGIKGIGISAQKPYVPTYDFSGEDFETDWNEIRKVNSKDD
jgi:hypothetical protein